MAETGGSQATERRRETSDDFDFEPVRGLPERLPEGEAILWQGAPDAWTLARRAFFVRLAVMYFAALGVWRIGDALLEGATVADALVRASALAAPAIIAIGLLSLFAYGVARTTVYTITNKRIVMRFGIALSVNLNLPFSRIAEASVRGYRNGCGDLPIQLSGEDYFAYMLLWPHARPGAFRKPEPMLRCVPKVAEVAQLLSGLLREAHIAAAEAPAAEAGPTPAIDAAPQAAAARPARPAPTATPSAGGFAGAASVSAPPKA